MARYLRKMYFCRLLTLPSAIEIRIDEDDRDTDDLELLALSADPTSPTSSRSEDDELLGPYRPARVQHANTWLERMSSVWSKYQLRPIPNASNLCTRRILQFAYPFSLIVTGAVISWIIILLWRPNALDPFDDFFTNFWEQRLLSKSQYPSDIFGSVLPIPCHSHNDYWRRTPLFAALGSGCISVEADVWLRDDNLYVGHTEHAASPSKTLQGMYINHLVEILDHMNSDTTHWKRNTPNGVFYNDPQQTLTLLIDFKSEAGEIWSVLYHQLRPLRERGWLTHWNGTHRIERPVTVVATGNADLHTLVNGHHIRDIFLDAPLNALEHFSDDGESFLYNVSNSYLASVKFLKALGPLSPTGFSDDQIQKLRFQIRCAKERGLVPRYWGIPRWPTGLRDEVWTVLIQEEIGLLNVDDLRAVRKGRWGSWSHGVVKRVRRLRHQGSRFSKGMH
ncbi:hypothetical protein BDV96DRAFT_571119 [Lophiotrema nucula]|uniref:Altered inheritance of mitochondria protein 6 n=1 Tax=Lophiotrema nucula TaxID=690887 RepID=A0A6A5ZFN4_9PLEO|nr:hypothetical protein BDV96DRAFT_571119 [Lophiotrema nucula]